RYQPGARPCASKINRPLSDCDHSYAPPMTRPKTRQYEFAGILLNNRIPLQSLTAANIMVEGSIIGYESNVKSGGVGARYFGIGADTQYQLDQIAVNLRVVNVSTGEILSSVNTSKTILSYEVQAGVFRFIDYQRLLEGEVGYTSNEPVMLCLMSAIETGVIFLINDGIDRGLWDLQNKAERQNDILVKYRHMSVPPES
ncbi:CsgG/HfaB family protein, partial [Escherichia coli]|uniref:CsgG/HfaB family protein n=3 Tax=Escherichia coli TaxID=562 RepID=UPI0024C253E4